MFIAILIGLLCIAGLTSLFIARKIPSTDRDTKFVFKTAGVIGIVLGLALLGLNSWHIVPPGHRGVQTTLGTMNMEPLGEGFQWVNVVSSVKDTSIQNRVDSSKFECETSDTQTIFIEVSYNWRPLPSKLTKLVKDNGYGFADIIIPPAMKECVKAEIAKHKVSDITQQRHAVKVAMQEAATAWLAKYDIELLEMSVSTIDFSDKYDHAIEEKQVAEQESQKALNILTKTKTEAEMAAATARGKADSKIEEARGEAESTLLAAKAKAQALEIEGAAQAAYNKKVAESLTPDLLHRLWIEKWVGTVPSTMLGGANTQFLLPLPQSK